MVKFICLIITFVPLFLFGQKSDTLIWEDNLGSSYLRGSIAYNYCLNQSYSNPYFKENLEFFRSLEEETIVLKARYDYTGSRAILRCDKIYIFCSILVNEELVLETNNAFHPWEVDITNFLKEGENSIKAIFTPSIQMGLNKAYPYIHPAPNDENTPQMASLVRKPQFMFGWDWAPRVNLMGFLDVVRIESENELFANPYVRLLEYEKGIAVIERSVDVKDTAIEKVLWEIDDVKKWFVVKSGKLTSIDTIVEAVLWKPGRINELYKEKWCFRNKQLQRCKLVNYGLRKVELVQTPDSLGTPFYFKLNNEFVFCKGSNLVPLDIFPERVGNEKLRNLVLDAHHANMNMLRVWGGGDYLPNYFYELCDSLGIMVWQDFMFACAMYPGNKTFLESVEKEAVYQVNRLRNHPCIVYFNGNNEVEVAWKNWGFQQEDKYGLTKSAQKEIERSYDQLFKGVLKKTVNENTNLPYVHTSPLSNWGRGENFNHSTMHYWGVWHGNDSLKGFWKQVGRFNAEFGFQSFPSPYALTQITTKENWSLENEKIKKRQKSYIGSEKIKNFVLRVYGGYTDFKDFVYKSQLLQAKGVDGAVRAHILSSPICGGSLFWQFNDCWAAPTWSAIDFYGERKALYYAVQNSFARESILQDPNKDRDFYFVSDNRNSASQKVKVEVFHFNGDKISSQTITTRSVSKQMIYTCDYKNVFVKFSFSAQERCFVIGDKLPFSDDSSVVIKEVVYDEITKKGVLKFQVMTFMQSLQLYSELYPIIFEENFKHYLPGIYSIKFELRLPVTPRIEDLDYQFLNKNV